MKQIKDFPMYNVGEDGIIYRDMGNWLRPLKNAYNQKGYCLVFLYNKYGRVRRSVHRIVTESYYGKSDLQVNHINGNKSDNRLCNLEYVTPKQNIAHAFLNGLSKNIGQTHGNAKLKEYQVFEIINLLKTEKSQSEIAKIYGVSPLCISNINTKKRWKHLFYSS